MGFSSQRWGAPLVRSARPPRPCPSTLTPRRAQLCESSGICEKKKSATRLTRNPASDSSNAHFSLFRSNDAGKPQTSSCNNGIKSRKLPSCFAWDRWCVYCWLASPESSSWTQKSHRLLLKTFPWILKSSHVDLDSGSAEFTYLFKVYSTFVLLSC